MRTLARFGSSALLVFTVLTVSTPAWAAEGSNLVCPPTLDDMGLYSSFLHEGDLGLRSTLDCSWGTEMKDGTAGDAAYVVVGWDATVDAGSEDGFSLCTGEPDTIGAASEIDRWSPDVQTLDSMIVSPTKRAAVTVRTWDYWDPPTGVDHQVFVDVARELLAVAETRALDCGAAGTNDGSSEGTAGGAPAGGTRSNRGTATALLAAGAGLSVLAGAGSLLAGRRPRTPVTPAGPPPTEALYSGGDAIRILIDAGLLEVVRSGEGGVVGYRPLGDLLQFIRYTPQWQPAFGTPVKTPGGTATHIGAVAFEEHPDGLLRDITIAVREAPSAKPTAGHAGTPADPPRPPGEPLADRLGRAWVDAHVYGVPFEAALNGPQARPRMKPPPAQPVTQEPAAEKAPPRPDPATASRPPADASAVPGWLASPGWKALKPADLSRMLPDQFTPAGTLKPFPFTGATPNVRIGGGTFSVEVSSPLPFSPDVKIRGSLSPSPSGGHLVPTLDELSVGGEPYGDLLEHQRKALSHLGRFTQPVRDAGLRFGEVRMEDGELQILVERPG